MPGQLEIMHTISTGLNEINRNTLRPETETKWTHAVLSKLCTIGQHRFQCKTRATNPDANDTEWLYDLVWLRYRPSNNIVVIECQMKPFHLTTEYCW